MNNSLILIDHNNITSHAINELIAAFNYHDLYDEVTNEDITFARAKLDSKHLFSFLVFWSIYPNKNNITEVANAFEKLNLSHINELSPIIC